MVTRMGWATEHIEGLKRGETVRFRPRGTSMAGRIESGQLVTVVPAAVGDVKANDVVLCRVNGRDYLHLVKAVGGGQAQIGNMRGRINGWTKHVFGKVVRVES